MQRVLIVTSKMQLLRLDRLFTHLHVGEQHIGWLGRDVCCIASVCSIQRVQELWRIFAENTAKMIVEVWRSSLRSTAISDEEVDELGEPFNPAVTPHASGERLDLA